MDYIFLPLRFFSEKVMQAILTHELQVTNPKRTDTEEEIVE